jgi:MFS family permease
MLADPVSASEKSQNPERRNIVFHVTATFFFKFGLEAFVGSYQALAANRYDADSDGTVTFQRIGLLTGLFQAFQCVGAILIGPLIQRHPSRLVLCCTSFFFSLLVAILLIIDAATGGTIKPRDWETINAADDFSYYGKFSTDCMIPIIALAGMAYGMIDQTRRVVPGVQVYSLYQP